jgi:hypothetical protein
LEWQTPVIPLAALAELSLITKQSFFSFFHLLSPFTPFDTEVKPLLAAKILLIASRREREPVQLARNQPCHRGGRCLRAVHLSRKAFGYFAAYASGFSHFTPHVVYYLA